MLVKRFGSASRYVAPNHVDVCSLRLQGFEPGGPLKSWVGLSHFLPGGGAGLTLRRSRRFMSSSPARYPLQPAAGKVTLGPLDSCCIPGGETREVKNVAG